MTRLLSSGSSSHRCASSAIWQAHSASLLRTSTCIMLAAKYKSNVTNSTLAARPPYGKFDSRCCVLATHVIRSLHLMPAVCTVQVLETNKHTQSTCTCPVAFQRQMPRIMQVPVFVLLLSKRINGDPQLVAAGSISLQVPVGVSSSLQQETVQLFSTSGKCAATVQLQIGIASRAGATVTRQATLAAPGQGFPAPDNGTQSCQAGLQPTDHCDKSNAEHCTSALEAKLSTHDLHYHYHLPNGAHVPGQLHNAAMQLCPVGIHHAAAAPDASASTPHAMAAPAVHAVHDCPGFRSAVDCSTQTQSPAQPGPQRPPPRTQPPPAWQEQLPPACQQKAQQVHTAAVSTLDQAAKVQQAVDALRASFMQKHRPAVKRKQPLPSKQTGQRGRPRKSVVAQDGGNAGSGMNALMAFAWEMIGFMLMRSALSAGMAGMPTIPPGHVVVPAEALVGAAPAAAGASTEHAAAPASAQAGTHATKSAPKQKARAKKAPAQPRATEAAHEHCGTGGLASARAQAAGNACQLASKNAQRAHERTHALHNAATDPAQQSLVTEHVQSWLHASPAAEHAPKATGTPERGRITPLSELPASLQAMQSRHAAAQHQGGSNAMQGEAESIVNVTRAQTPHAAEGQLGSRSSSVTQQQSGADIGEEEVLTTSLHEVGQALLGHHAAKPPVTWADSVISAAAKELQQDKAFADASGCAAFLPASVRCHALQRTACCALLRSGIVCIEQPARQPLLTAL